MLVLSKNEKKMRENDIVCNKRTYPDEFKYRVISNYEITIRLIVIQIFINHLLGVNIITLPNNTNIRLWYIAVLDI